MDNLKLKNELNNELNKISSMMVQLDDVWYHLNMLGVKEENCPITQILEYLYGRYTIVQGQLNKIAQNEAKQKELSDFKKPNINELKKAQKTLNRILDR